MDILLWIAKIAVLVLLAQYLVGPVLVWLSYRHPARYRLAEGEPGVEPLDPSPAHSAACMALESLGFVRLQSSGFRGAARARVTLFHHADGTVAYTASLESGGKRLEFCEFGAAFQDGDFLMVNNSGQILGLPEAGPRILHRLPQLESPLELHEAFLKLRDDQVRRGRTLLDITPDRVAAVIDDYLNSESAWFAAAGYFRPSTPEQLRPTLKGALVLTWRQCFPVRQWIDHSGRRASIRALQQ